MRWRDRRLLRWIEKTDEGNIGRIIQAILTRYGKRHPEWEMVVLVLPKEKGDARQRYLAQIVQTLGCGKGAETLDTEFPHIPD